MIRINVKDNMSFVLVLILLIKPIPYLSSSVVLKGSVLISFTEL